jgi:Rrf2 family iron-sulfur cluster assembly transcriptional regulator
LVFPSTLRPEGLEYRSSALVFKTFWRSVSEEDAVKLSTKGRYAVMAMVDLARHAQAKPVSLSDIAARQEISLSYLEQLFARLRRAELVKSVRGPGGGYRLARTSADTRVSEIILAVDEPIKATRCTEMGASGCRADRSKCLTHDLWEELGNQIHLFLNSVSLSDVLERKLTTRIIEAPAAANSDSMAAAS